jgi:aspartate aminotransferase-like enzyme
MPIPTPLDHRPRMLCGPGAFDVEPSVPAAMRPPMLGHLDFHLEGSHRDA